MSITGIENAYWGHALWILKKQMQVAMRRHLSAFLALILAILVAFSERVELLAIWKIWPPKASWLLIFVITAGTFIAALWELLGNKRKISHQETLFLYGLKTVLDGFDRLLGADDDERNADERLREFTQGAINAYSLTLSGCFETDAGIMFKQRRGRSIELDVSSTDAMYPDRLVIPLPPGRNQTISPGDTGPAGISYDRLCLVYVPKKKTKKAFPFLRMEDSKGMRYTVRDPIKCWVHADDPEKEDFRTVLCAPVSGYQTKDKDQKFGVLNFSTKSRDPFVDRDFMMAECFAKILGIANRWRAKS
jgi:hypothetical protein